MRPVRPVVHHRRLRRRAVRRRVLWAGGELLVTVGVLVLLLVVHETWWTNRQARAGAQRQVAALEREWEGEWGTVVGHGAGGRASPRAEKRGRPGRTPGSVAAPVPEPASVGRRDRTASPAYAVLSIPRLRLRVPVAEGTGRRDVLDKGYVGHYRATQQPGQAGNFAVAGHRNTHGEPFRYVNRLRRGDEVRVETAAAVYMYAVDQVLPQTSPRDSGVLAAVPRSAVRPGYGYTGPGYYLTLTTCTPEYTSRYRLVVWGKLVRMRPR
ncbi:class E sortase [Streptomyces sp. Ru71]|uniref:class E sortase n=1 Tax=Streptomyces sp. Ru71 TaxID=2080746 RepID=UPI0021564845